MMINIKFFGTLVGSVFLLMVCISAIVMLTGCRDDRYDKCEQQYPATKDYRACVKKFQDQDDEDAVIANSTVTMAAAATMQ